MEPHLKRALAEIITKAENVLPGSANEELNPTEKRLTKSLTGDLPDIAGAWRAYKEKRIKQSPQNNLRASSIGHTCERYHYHSIHDWKERPLHDAILQSIFDEGNLHETDTIRQLTEMGFGVVESQRAFQMDKPLVTGSIDGILLWEGRRFPFDVKSVKDTIFQELESAEDMMFSKKHWHRQYPAQLQMYLLLTNQEVGCFILKNKTTGEIKPIWMQIDYDYTEQLLKRAERVYSALKAEEPGPRVNDFDICTECPFKALCLPDLRAGPGVIVIEDAEIASLLDRRAEIEDTAKEFKEIDETVKEQAKARGKGDLVCGSWMIRVTEYNRKEKVALTWEEKISTFLKTQIVKIDG